MVVEASLMGMGSLTLARSHMGMLSTHGVVTIFGAKWVSPSIHNYAALWNVTNVFDFFNRVPFFKPLIRTPPSLDRAKMKTQK